MFKNKPLVIKNQQRKKIFVYIMNNNWELKMSVEHFYHPKEAISIKNCRKNTFSE